jgi:DNA-binding GntR family transcriptional regulator
LQQPSAVQAVVDGIKTRIRHAAYLPGQRLVAHQLAQEFSASAGVIRESLRQLAGEGLVELHDNRGAQLRSLDRRGIEEIFQLRESVEGLAAALAAARMAEAAPRARFAQAAAACAAAAEGPDVGAYAAANLEFHRTVIELSGNRRLPTIAEQLVLPVQRLHLHRFLDRRAIANSAAEHARVAAAILAGDARAARQRMATHVRNSGRAVLALLDDPADPPRTRRPPRRQQSGG